MNKNQYIVDRFVGVNEFGSLGILHLNRMWMKLLIEIMGGNNPDPMNVEQRFDEIVLQGIGLKREELLEHLLGQKYQRPVFSDFEHWLKVHPIARVTANSAVWINQEILGYEHDEDTVRLIAEELAARELAAEGRVAVRFEPPTTFALHLNSLVNPEMLYNQRPAETSEALICAS